jgi:hypothetical protein
LSENTDEENGNFDNLKSEKIEITNEKIEKRDEKTENKDEAEIRDENNGNMLDDNPQLDKRSESTKELPSCLQVFQFSFSRKYLCMI